MNTNEEGIIEDIDVGEGSGSDESKFVEQDGKKFIDDGTGKPKLGDDGNPIPFIENQKPIETPEARKARLDRMQEQHKKKYPELYGEKPDASKKSKKSEEFDYGQKAFLISNGIKTPEEMALVMDYVKNTGKSLDDVVGSKHFQAELKELRDAASVAAATPGQSKRSGQSASSTVEYWLAKGELPPNTPENQKLRTEVVNARMKKESVGNQFTSQPVASNK